jgi:hypothetical protein
LVNNILLEKAPWKRRNEMFSKIVKILTMSLTLFLVGIGLQCSSDPSVIGDGGIVDQFLADLGIKDQCINDNENVDIGIKDLINDGIGANADAADASGPITLTKKEYTGVIKAASGTVTVVDICDKGMKGKVPIATAWFRKKNSTTTWLSTTGTVPLLLWYTTKPECFRLQSGQRDDMEYKIAVIY